METFSPMQLIRMDNAYPPILIMHGADDMVVPIDQSRRFMRCLAASIDGDRHRLAEEPLAGHVEFTAAMRDMLDDFLRRHLAK